MIIYLLKTASCLALLLLFYHFVLEKEKMHNFNRFYLLGSVSCSLLMPFVAFTTILKPTLINSNKALIKTMYANKSATIIAESALNYSQILIGFYCLVSVLLVLRFSINLFKIIQKISIHKKIKYHSATLILVDDEVLPHTFWNYIFINKIDYENNKIEKELFTHELTHATQKHTLDILIIELLQAVFWINPLFIFLKKAIQLNHEFLADENVINQHKNTVQYQHLLLNKAAWNNEYYLASNLNYSLTKKRLKMMTKQSSSTIVLFKKLAIIPVLTGFIFLFAERVEAQETTIVEEITEIIEVPYLPLDRYKAENKYYEANRLKKPHFIKSSKERQEDLTQKFSELSSLYFNLSRGDKKKTNRTIYPHYPYRRLMKNNKVFYKLKSKLTEADKLLIPPPPPVPDASKEEVLKAKNAYIAWKKRTGNDNAPPPPIPKPLKKN
jgi:bla regulator protein BlaR1